ncbi:thioredoxin family protein [Lysinibacillus fusiformis]|nr:thioredoxin family protein [Lysinibacillus fusiformis]
MEEKESMWVYIGRPTCEECVSFTPVLQEVLKENNEQIYYYNTDEVGKENTQEMIAMLDKLEVKVMPTIIRINKGEVLKKAVGYQDKAGLEALLKE